MTNPESLVRWCPGHSCQKSSDGAGGTPGAHGAGVGTPLPQTCQAWGRVLAWDMAHGLRACPWFLVLLLSRHCQCKEAEAVLSGHREGRGEAKLSQGGLCSAAAARYKPTSRLTKQSWALFIP